jgi:acetoin utilization protein AcuB
MRVAAAMTREVVTVPPELALSACWSIMQRRRIRHLPVVAHARLVGILSDRDVLLRSRADQAGLVPDAMSAEQAMTAVPVTCRASTTVAEAASLMIEQKIDALPVVDASGHLTGLVTSTDLLSLLTEDEHLRHELPFVFRVVQLTTAEAA